MRRMSGGQAANKQTETRDRTALRFAGGKAVSRRAADRGADHALAVAVRRELCLADALRVTLLLRTTPYDAAVEQGVIGRVVVSAVIELPRSARTEEEAQHDRAAPGVPERGIERRCVDASGEARREL